MTARKVRSFCRICNAHCGMVLTIDDSEHIVDIRGDKDQPMSRGYVCFKGLQAEEAHHGPARLLRPLKRTANGFIEIALESALDEIAQRLGGIIERGGPHAVALFNGNGGTPNSSGYPMSQAFLAALGSASHYSTLSIDQSAKIVSFERQGGWAAGLQDMQQSDVLLFFGTNPLVSHSTVPVMGPDPVRRMKAAKARGMRLIVIDPRRTETAHHADVFLQPLPGQDAVIAAAMLRIILDEGWADVEFCRAHVGQDRLADLRAAIEPCNEPMVERRAGLRPGQLRAAAAMFARDHKRGAAYAATGPCMAPFSNLTQHLVETLNIVCGRFRRPGDRVIVDLTAADRPVTAEVIPPPRSWQSVPPSRIRGVGILNGERLTGTLAEEILTPGEGQIRAMLVNGANPASSVPDQRRIVEALRSLELLVAIEPYMTPTAELADYILPPRMQYERADLPLLIPGFPLQPDNWLQFTPAVLAPPAGSELTEDWYVFWSLARRLGLQIDFAGELLDMQMAPATEELLARRMRGGRVSFDELRKHPSGMKLPDGRWTVVQGSGDGTARFDPMPADVAEELRQCIAAAPLPQGYTHLLASRRLRDVFNSNGPQLSKVRARNPSNAAFLHPRELAALGVTPGDKIEIASQRGRIRAIARADETLRSGVVSMAHCWGGLPDSGSPDGDNINLLIDCASDVEAVNAMPRMSAIPVRLQLARGEI